MDDPSAVVPAFRRFDDGRPLIQPTDVPGTAEVYARISPQKVILVPLHGWDTVKPFVDRGRDVTLIGCFPTLHPDGCGVVRDIIRSWPFADQIGHIIDCDEMPSFWETLRHG